MKFNLDSVNRVDLLDGKRIIFLVIGLSVLSGLLGVWLTASLISEFKEASKRENMERVANLYSMTIDAQWDKSFAIEKTISFLKKNEVNVSEVWLVNNLAGVISPVSKAYDLLNDAYLDDILANNKTAPKVQINNTKVYTVFLDEESSIKGVLVIDFAKAFLNEKISFSNQIVSVVFICTILSVFDRFAVDSFI